MSTRRNQAMALLCGALVLACNGGASDACVAMGTRETLDAALARTPEGGTLCLPVGEIGPPSAAIDRTVTLRGAVDASGQRMTTITGGAGSCLLASGVESGVSAYPMLDASSVLVTTGSGTVTLEHVIVADCTYGVTARASSTVLDDVRVESVLVATLVDHGASLEAHGSELASGTRRPDGSGPSLGVGVMVGGAAAILLENVVADGGGAGFAIRGMPRSLEVTDGEIHSYSFGLAIDDRSDAARQVTISGTHVHDLASIAIAGFSPVTGNVLASGTVSISGARFEGNGTSSIGLQLEDVDHATIHGTSFTGHDQFSVGAFGSTLEIGEGTSVVLPSSTGIPVGVVSAQHPSSMRSGAVTLVGSTMPFTSSATGSGVHLSAQTASMLGASGAMVTLTGGQVGALALDGTLALSGSAFSSSGATVGSVVGIMHGQVTLDALALSPASDAVGVIVEDDAMLDAGDLTLSGGRIGIQAEDRTLLDAHGGTYTGATQSAVYVTSSAGSSAVRDVAMMGPAVGVIVEGASAAVRVDGGTVMNATASGMEARSGATLTVVGVRIDGAHGASLAFTDANGFVAGSMITHTALRADGRADDVRIVSTDGAMHSVDLGDDGDGIITSSDLNFIVLDPSRSCAGSCSVVLSQGVGAQAIVRPNCLNGDATSDGDVHTLVDQMGGTFVVPVPQTWTAQFAGLASNLGLIAGVPASVVALAAPMVTASVTANVPAL